MLNAVVVSTFPNDAWEVYAKEMLQSFVRYWPKEIGLLLQLDDDLLKNDVEKIIRPQDAVNFGRLREHHEFVNRNKDKDDPKDYRKQAVRFCHKVFVLKHAADSVMAAKKEAMPDAPRYLIWMDADVITTSEINEDLLKECLPKDGDAVSYMGRKDWEHSECGWLAFDMDNKGYELISSMHSFYDVGRDGINGLFKLDQWHDSWVFDSIVNIKKTNLTKDKPGMDIWQHSPMAKFSHHYKGPEAKHQLMQKKNIAPVSHNVPVQIICKNSIPDKDIQDHIRENQLQIKNWIKRGKITKSPISVVSAGPLLTPEDLYGDRDKGIKIVAVKHALQKLLDGGVTPWATILLDPREHVYDFVQNPSKDIIWFVASQTHPKVVKKLLDSGCNVWGYHAPVGANEYDLFKAQEHAIVSGGSASATRGLYLLEALGFRKFRLYGYELSLPRKPNMTEINELGSPKYLSVTVGAKSSVLHMERDFWTEGQLGAQIQEMTDIIDKNDWNIKAFGFGVVPFVCKTREINNLRKKRWEAKMVGIPQFCDEFLWPKPIKSLMRSPRKRRKTRHKRQTGNNS